MRWTKRTLILAAIATAITFAYGPLFPWSPVHPGYETLRLNRGDVLYPSGTAPDPAYLQLDRLIAESEQFHGLQMPRRITFVACRSWTDFQRFVPQIRGRAVAAVTIQTGTAIFVTPKVYEKHLDLTEFLRHELSHAALHQNQSLLDAYRLEQQQWFCEGLAVLFGRQRSYLSAAEFTARAAQEDLLPLFDGKPQTDMRLAYQAWRYFLDYTIQTQGRDSFLRLERTCLGAPATCRPDPQALEAFQTSLRQGSYHPTD